MEIAGVWSTPSLLLLLGPQLPGSVAPVMEPFIRGARSVMVIVVGNGLGDTSSNPGRD